MDETLKIVEFITDNLNIIIPLAIGMGAIIIIGFYIKFAKRAIEGLKEIFSVKGFLILLVTIAIIIMYLIYNGTIII